MRAVNLSIAVFLGALLGSAYWFAWRPLPKTSGSITAPIAMQATVVRDAIGVPHISAGSWEDAIFLQGYVTAQDRMWQMDALRRLAAGELAEVVGGTDALESDRDSRRLRLPRLAQLQEQTLTPKAKAVFAAYARGVNYYLENQRGRLPLEFTLLNYQPRPWRVQDTLLIGLQMYRMLTTSWEGEIRKQHMLEKGDAQKVAFLFPARAGEEVAPGSNAWAISGAHTASGKPILAGDPHLDFSIPSPWYLVHLSAPGLDVTGASLAGVPAVLVGHNRQIAWSVTNLEFDVQDLYREHIDDRGRYEFQGQIQQAVMEKDVIAVKGQKPVTADLWVTRHGPVMVSDHNQNYALRWTAAETAKMDFPFLAINRANNWEEFDQALQRYAGPAQNFVYADTAGNIGYHVAGLLPIRQGCMGDVPADGASGACEWQGAIPYADLPNAFNPASGIIASANQNPFPEDYPYPVNGGFVPPFRASQIRSLLQAHDKWKPEEMLSIQKDVYAAFSQFLAQEAVKAWEKKPGLNAQIREAVDVLRGWNGQMEKGAAAPMIAALLYDELKQAAAHRAAPGVEDEYGARLAPVVIEKLLRERPADWFPDYDELLRTSLTAAVGVGAKLQGSEVSRWDYGQAMELRIEHPVGKEIPLLGRYFNIGPVPMSGSPFTVKQTTKRLGPSMRMVVDLSDLEKSQANITIGESGQWAGWLSPHYKDQWSAYYGGTSFPMQFQKVDARATLVIKPQ